MRSYHPDFVDYQRAIASHPSYSTLPNRLNANGEITWVKVKDSERKAWWEQRRIELGLSSWAEVARAIFPSEMNRLKPCQQCGRKLSIDYVYPNKNSLKRLNDALAPLTFLHFRESIHEIVEVSHEHFGDSAGGIVALCFGLDVKDRSRSQLLSDLLEQKSRLSPGVMSNPPDRLDGFHSDNGCHRAESDKGRHTSNMQSYARDRRAFENWADGDWSGANTLMGEFRKNPTLHECPRCGKWRKMTADHVGPISLGFTHRMKFNPLCGPCNSRKQNSMSLADVQQLLLDEQAGEVVVSWHSKPILDALKLRVVSDETADRISQLMSQNMLKVLWLFASISDSGHFEFLTKNLGTQYANWQYKITKFDSSTGDFEYTKRKVNTLNSEKQKVSLLRVSAESLKDFTEKENRRVDRKIFLYDDEYFAAIVLSIEEGNTNFADLLVLELLTKWAADFSIEF